MPRRLLLAGLAALALAACDQPRPTEPDATGGPPIAGSPAPDAVGPPTVFASGLLYPRGLAFGPDGALYVAEAGTVPGHTTLTVGQCEQVPAPLGPFRGGATGRISRVDAAGTRSTVASGLPSGVNGMSSVIGTASVAFVGPQLYALVAAGCSHGHVGAPSSVLRIAGDGSWTVAADLSAWILANPAANPEPDDFEPDGDWYSMAAAGGLLYAVEANQGNLVSVDPAGGGVTRLADVSATEGHVVPTASAVSGDEILVGELTPFPAVPGAARILRYGRDGQRAGALTGFTAVLGVDADQRGNVYVLESFTCATSAPCFPSPGSGRVVRVGSEGAREVIATGLSFATSLRLGPDGALYVLTGGYGPPGAGAVVRIAAPDAANAAPTVEGLRADPAAGPYGVSAKACGGRYTVCVRFQVADPDGASDGPFRVALDWGDGSVWAPNSVPAGTPLLAPHDYAAPGTYTVRITVTDRRGATRTATLALEVVAGRPAGGTCTLLARPVVLPPLPGQPANVVRRETEWVCELLDLGRTTVASTETGTAGPSGSAVTGTAIYTAANGGRLFTTFSGAETVTGGAGRFAGASGAFTRATRVNVILGSGQYEITGTLSY